MAKRKGLKGATQAPPPSKSGGGSASQPTGFQSGKPIKFGGKK